MSAKPLWFAAVLVVLAGYVFVFRAAEARIDDRRADNARIAAQLAAAERTLQARGALERERHVLHERLRRVDLDGDRTAVEARFVRAAARIAAQHRTTIASISAQGGASRSLAPVPAQAPVVSQTSADPFEPIALDLTVEGRYADVLATIAALSGARALAAVDVVALARKQAGSADPTLSAQLRVAIEYLAAPATTAQPATLPVRTMLPLPTTLPVPMAPRQRPMFALGPRSRAALVAGGIVSFALAYATTPLVASSAAVPLVADTLPVAASSPPRRCRRRSRPCCRTATRSSVHPTRSPAPHPRATPRSPRCRRCRHFPAR